ncbi:uncharacterized protein LOC123676855 [Harmonia axyridis]|uniref:uncharacterized protein LOC123676855 n=1 Tax=Harmonia axyridis TaxID=115357 RepID=UPI001E27767C|nr:uncharacterized protein LOC123676855 [Harmonia axyridis]
MLRLGMLLSCIFISNQALEDSNHITEVPLFPEKSHLHLGYFEKREISVDFDKYAVTCYICVNVSDNVICNQYAIDKPCRPGETFCHTLHVMDSKGNSVLVNKKCTTDRECQRSKVGCVDIDSQKMCVSCCDKDYCNSDVPTNSTNATFDNRISKMRMLAKNLFTDQEKAMTTTIKKSCSCSTFCFTCILRLAIIWHFFVFRFL